MSEIYNKAYQEWRDKCQFLFTEEYRTPNLDKTEKLIDGFSVNFQTFHGEINECNIFVSENTLFDQAGKAIFTWRNLDTGGQFATMFLHSNGKHYLVFRIDLYGYGVLELESGKELYYIPAEAYPEESEEFDETFIWTDVNYDIESNLLAASGCYWACPYSVVIVDFSDPLAEQSTDRWLDVCTIIDPKFTGIDLVGWQNSVLCLKVNEQPNEIFLTTEELKKKMKDIRR